MKRSNWFAVALFLIALATTAPVALAAGASYDLPDLGGIQNAPKAVDVNVNIGDNADGDAWVVSPVWLAIGGVALLVVIALIVMSLRGESRGTTVVRG